MNTSILYGFTLYTEDNEEINYESYSKVMRDRFASKIKEIYKGQNDEGHYWQEELDF